MGREVKNFEDMGILMWTDPLPGQALADVCNLKAPCKLKSFRQELHAHVDADGSTAQVRIVAVTEIDSPGGWTTFAPLASAQDVLLVLGLITGMGLPAGIKMQ